MAGNARLGRVRWAVITLSPGKCLVGRGTARVNSAKVIVGDRSPTEAVMSLFIAVLAWAGIALGTLTAAVPLVSLTVSHVHARRPPPGAHAKPALTEPGARSKAWREFRKSLLAATAGVILLSDQLKHAAAAKWLVGVAIFVIVIGELGSWLRLTEPGARSRAWQELRWSLLPAATAVFWLVDGWKHAIAGWLLSIFLFAVVAPDLDSWIRSRVSRKSDDPTAEPS